jgi:Tfp pilus assembly protein PilV
VAELPEAAVGAGRAFDRTLAPVDVRTTGLQSCGRRADLMGVMRRTTRRGPEGPFGLAASESGFALIEVMVSAVLVIVLATATLAIIERSASSAAGNRQRTMAVALAQADQDSMRQLPIASLADWHKSLAKTQGNTRFTIKSDALWLRDAGGPVACNANSARAEYVKITSQVSWAGHPKPVILESYIAPGVAGVQRGALTVRLKSDPGVGTPGIPVAVSGGGTGLTDGTGCVVLGNLTPGANTVTWGASGYVDRNGDQQVSESVSIATGQTAQIERLYDRAASAKANFVNELGAGVPWTGVSVTHAGITKPTTATRSFDNGSFATQGTAVNLFPFVVPYSFYAGTCIGNAPTTWLPSATMASAAVAAGSTTTTVPVRVPTVAVQVLKADGTPATDVPISIRPATPATTYPKMAGCNERIPLATGTGSGQVRTAPATAAYPGFASVNLPPYRPSVNLPYGQWLVCADNGNNRRQTVVLNNTPQGTTPAADAPSQGIPYATLQAMTGVPNVPSVKITLPATNNGNPAC